MQKKCKKNAKKKNNNNNNAIIAKMYNSGCKSKLNWKKYDKKSVEESWQIGKFIL